MNLPSLKAAAKSLLSIAVGGASASLLKIYNAGMDFARLDYHQVAQAALVGAAVALLFHWAPPPNTHSPAIR